jgi:hypothetical protein
MQALDTSTAVRWRTAWGGAVAHARWCGSIPLSRWPLNWHAAAATAVVMVFATAAWVWEAQQAQRQHRSVSELAQLRERLHAVRHASVSGPAVQRPLLADPTRADAVLRDLGTSAPAGLKITELRIDHEGVRTPAVRQIRFEMKAQGEYAALKTWIGEVLARHATLALSALTVRRPEGASPYLEISVSFTLFVRAGQP